jgi:hypothetical protein
MSDSYLVALYQGASTASTANTILGILNGGTGSGTQLSSNPVTALQIAETTSASAVSTEAEQPQVLQAVAAFKTAISQAKNAAQLLSNPNFLKVFLTANGLGGQTAYPALAKQALLSNPSDKTSLANTLSNTAWASAVNTYQFATKGLSIIQNPKSISAIASGYAEVLWRQSLDAGTPGLSNALTFRQEASSITSVDQILGDPVLRTVVTTALGIPEQIANQSLTAQEQAISSRVNIKDFTSQSFVDNFTNQYLIQESLSASRSSTGSDSLTQLAVQAGGLVV